MNWLYINPDLKVENVIVWDGVAPLQLPDGYSLELQTGQVWLDWQKIDGVWTPPPIPEE